MQRAFLRSLLSHPAMRAFAVLDREGRALELNAKAREWFTPAFAAQLRPLLQQLLQQPSQAPERAVTCRHRSPLGEMECRVLAVVDRAGGVRGFTLSFYPVSDSTSAGESLEAERWRYVLENALDGFWDRDLDSGRVFYSARYKELLGYAPDEFDDNIESWSSRVHGDDLVEVEAAMRAHFEGRAPAYVAEHRLRHRDGTWRWMLDRGRVVSWHGDGRPRRMLGTLTDIGAYKALEARLREGEALLAEAQRVGRIGSYAWDLASGRVQWSAETYRLFGRDPGLPGLRYEELLALCTPGSVADLERAVRAAIEDGQPFQLEIGLTRPDGQARRLDLRGAVMCGEGLSRRLVGVVMDVTEQHLAEARAKWQADLLERISAMGRIGGFDWELDGDRIHWTDEVYRIHGLPVGQPLEWAATLALYDEPSQARLQQMFQSLREGAAGSESAELCLFTPDGRRVWLHCQAAARSDERGGLHISGLLQDISAEREAGERIEQLAHYDNLTGLPNRFLFRQRAQSAIEEARRHSLPLALLFVDLDRFKNVNDSLGHATGDQLLFEIGGRLRSCVRGSDLVGRLSGDEFLVLLREIRRAEDASIVAAKIIDAVAQPIELAGAELRIGCSIGIALLDEQVADLDALLRAADAAMYAAKDRGRSTFAFYSEEFRQRAQRRLTLESQLRRAIARDQLHLVYQPTVYLHSGAVAGIEALLRWVGEDGETRSPIEFIPIAEECGEILPIGDWVLHQACRQAQAWRQAGCAFERIAVNVSAIQLRDPDFAPRVLRVCTAEGWPPEALQLELTESALMRESEVLARAFATFEAHGISLAVDDFGTGFSNLHYLTRFPVQALKIDRSFVAQMLHDAGAQELTRAIIGLGHALSMQVVAEGVETEQALELLAQQGCDEAQGYLFSRPLDAAAMIAWLQQRP